MEAINSGTLDEMCGEAALPPTCVPLGPTAFRGAARDALGLENEEVAEVLPVLSKALSRSLYDLAGRAAELTLGMESSLAEARELFLERLYAKFAQVGIYPCEKLHIGLNSSGVLSALGVGGESGGIFAAVLSQDKELALFFADIAWGSQLLRTLEGFGGLLATGAPSATPLEWAEDAEPQLSEFSAYRLTLKGEMSHFYFR